MLAPGDWIQPQVVTTGCCEGARWRLRLPGRDDDRSQSRLAGLAENPAATAEVMLAVARRGGRLPRLILAERLYQDSSFIDEYPDVATALCAVATETGDPDLLDRLVFSAGFPPEAVSGFAASPDHRVRAKVPFMDSCPPHTLAALAEDPHPEVRRSVACLPDTGRELLIKLARDPDQEVRQTVGDRLGYLQSMPAEVVEILARDPIAAVRACVAEVADPWLAEELARDPDPEARVGAAGSGQLSAKSMELLADDPDVRVRSRLGWSDHTTAAVLTILAADPDPVVRRAVAFHSATPVAILVGLAADPDDEVAGTAVGAFMQNARRPLPPFDHLEASAERLSVEQLRGLIGATVRTGCDPGPRPWPVEEAEDTRKTLLARCAASRFARLRALAAADWWLPADIAAVLADDRDPMVRRWLAKNSRHHDILRRLAEKPARGVGDALAGNSFTPPDLLERLPAKPHRLARHWNAPGTLLVRLLDGAAHATRIAVAEHPNTPPEVLADLARGDAERDVIRAACANPALPVSVMLDTAEQTGLCRR